MTGSAPDPTPVARAASQDAEGAVAPEARDWDLRLPDVVLYAAPIALALFCLLLSQANDVVFWGFEEDEPATPLSTALMLASLLIALAGARRPDLPRPFRIIGGIMALLAGVAALDENLLWHEWLGRQIQWEVSSLPHSLTWYTDDVVVLLGAIVGTFIVYRCIRYVARAYETPRQSLELLPYLACVAVFAVAHGLLDILGHSHYMVDRIWPALSEGAANDYVERISYFEEICKLWTEWFVVLMLLKLLHRQRGSLVWSLLVAVGSMMAVLGGLWGVDDAARGIPCLTVGEPLDFLRNFHSLFALVWIWTAWAAIGWVCFRRTPRRVEPTGVLFVLPLALVLGSLVDADGLGRTVGAVANALMDQTYYGASVARHGLLFASLLIPGLAVGIGAGKLIKRWPLASGIALAVTCGAFSSWRSPSLATTALVAVTGVLLIVSELVHGRRRTALLTALVLTVALLAGSAWWAIGALTWAVLAWALDAPEERLRRRTATLLAVAAVQLALSAIVVQRSAIRFTPNYEWEPDPHPVFEVMFQPLDDPDPDRDD